jgi:hypothetical protein
MSALNILSLIAGTAAQPQQGNNASANTSQEGAVESGFAPVLNEQVQQLQGVAANVVMVPQPASGFMQRLSVVVSEDVVSQESGEQGLDLQALVGLIQDMLQQQGNAMFGRVVEDGEQAGGISVEMLANLQPEQIESLATILNVPTADIKLALEKLVKEYLASGSEFIVPAASNDEDNFYAIVKKGEMKDKIVDSSQDVATNVQAPVTLLNALPQDNGSNEEAVSLDIHAEQTAEEILLVKMAAVAANAATKVSPEEAAQKQAALVAQTSVVAASANTAEVLDVQSVEEELIDADASEDTDSDSEISEKAIVQSGWLGIPIATATLPQIASGFSRKIADTVSTLSALKAPEIKSGFQGVSSERVKEASSASLPQIAEKTGKAGERDAVSDAEVSAEGVASENLREEEKSNRKTSLDHQEIKDASERSKQAVSKAETRFDFTKDDRRSAKDSFSPSVSVSEAPMSRDFSDSAKISDMTPEISAIKDLPAPAASKHIERAPVFKNPQPYQPVSEQVLVKIRDVANHDGKQIQISLDPKDLGKVDVRMDVGADGRTQITMTVDKRETLDMLQRDRVSLEKTLNELGMKTDSGGMSFNLREQPRGQQQLADQNQQQGGRGWIGEPLPEELREEMQPTQPYRSGYIVTIDEGVNISV